MRRHVPDAHSTVVCNLKQPKYLSISGKMENGIVAASSTEHCAHRRKLTSAAHSGMKFKDNIGQQKQIANECYLNHSCKVNIQYLHTIFCLGIHTRIYINIYVYT